MKSGKTLLSTTLFFSLVRAFTFSHNAPTECDQFTVQWSGGAPPFSLLITPSFDNPRNFPIPASASNSFSIQLPLAAGQQFVVSMSDSTGSLTGGVSDLLTVGTSVSGVSCDTKVPTPSFQFQLSNNLKQCAPFRIAGYNAAVQPVTIIGLIPLGTPVQLQPKPDQFSFNWDQVNVAAGTNIIFFLMDSRGNFGGSSHVLQVADSRASDCIDDSSPRPTAVTDTTIAGSLPTSTNERPTSTSAHRSSVGTATRTRGAATSTSTAKTPTSKRVTGGSIAAAVIGGLIGLLVLGNLLFFWFKRLSKRGQGTWQPTSHRTGGVGPDFLGEELHPSSSMNSYNTHQYGSQPPAPWTTFSGSGSEYTTEPWMHHSPQSSSMMMGGAHAIPPPSPHESSLYTPTPYNVWTESQAAPSRLPARSKSTTKSPPRERPRRLVLHTDSEDTTESPPQYPQQDPPPSQLPYL